MAPKTPQNPLALDHASTVLIAIAAVGLVPILFVAAVRIAVPVPYEPVLPGLNGSYLLVLGFAVMIILLVLLVGYYRDEPPLRVRDKNSKETPAEIVSVSLAIGVIGIGVLFLSMGFIGSELSDGGGALLHGIAVAIPILVGLACLLSAIAGVVEARRASLRPSGE